MDQHILKYHAQYKAHLRSSLYKENIKKGTVSINKKYTSTYYNKKSKIFEGDKNAIMYWKYINSLQDEFYDFQEELTKMAFQLTLPQLYYGEEWRHSETQIAKMYGCWPIRKYMVYEAARKEGKTFIAMVVAAAALLAIPPRDDTFIIALVSLSLKNATDMLAKLYSIISNMSFDRERIKIIYQIEKVKIEFYDKSGKYIGMNLIEPKQSGGVSILTCSSI